MHTLQEYEIPKRASLVHTRTGQLDLPFAISPATNLCSATGKCEIVFKAKVNGHFKHEGKWGMPKEARSYAKIPTEVRSEPLSGDPPQTTTAELRVSPYRTGLYRNGGGGVQFSRLENVSLSSCLEVANESHPSTWLNAQASRYSTIGRKIVRIHPENGWLHYYLKM